jgi:hypothetical protein
MLLDKRAQEPPAFDVSQANHGRLIDCPHYLYKSGLELKQHLKSKKSVTLDFGTGYDDCHHDGHKKSIRNFFLSKRSIESLGSILSDDQDEIRNRESDVSAVRTETSECSRTDRSWYSEEKAPSAPATPKGWRRNSTGNAMAHRRNSSANALAHRHKDVDWQANRIEKYKAAGEAQADTLKRILHKIRAKRDGDGAPSRFKSSHSDPGISSQSMTCDAFQLVRRPASETRGSAPDLLYSDGTTPAVVLTGECKQNIPILAQAHRDPGCQPLRSDEDHSVGMPAASTSLVQQTSTSVRHMQSSLVLGVYAAAAVIPPVPNIDDDNDGENRI